ncbi:ABC transporter substrate-binding protein, partial [Leucobacter sp. M11]|uniref:ABC transporter substrate-binding protein n=1 Tax=Leucobacter sp. M11 TaxID=2993565 RepID=UPI002D7F377C
MRSIKIAVAALSVLAIAGCSPAGNPPETAGDGPLTVADLAVTTPPASGPVDLVSWNVPYGEPNTIDPIKAFNYSENTVVANLCESLMRIQPDNSIVPALAASVATPDPQTYVYQLRDGVTFWDGTPMSDADVLFSLKRHLDPAEGSFWAGDISANVASIETTAAHEITVRLKQPDATFNSYMATPLGSVVQEAHRTAAGDDYGNPEVGVMCTGPYQVEKWTSGSKIALSANEHYWDETLTPVSPRVDIHFITDAAAITAALNGGEIQGSYDVPLSSVSTLSSSTTGTLTLGRSTQMLAVISTGQGTFGDPAVRRALLAGLDRDLLAETVFEGTATAASSIVPDGGWSSSAAINEAGRQDLPGTGADLDAARAALDEATADLTTPIRIAYPAERTYYADVLSELSNVATELGMTVEPVAVPSDGYGTFFTDPEVRNAYDGFVTTNYMDVPDPLTFWSAILATGGTQNYTGISVPEIDEL